VFTSGNFGKRKKSAGGKPEILLEEIIFRKTRLYREGKTEITKKAIATTKESGKVRDYWALCEDKRGGGGSAEGGSEQDEWWPG